MTIHNRNSAIAATAVRQLRVSKLRMGHPFLIYSKDLPSRHGYLEFPGGQIFLITVKEGEHDFTIIRELSHEENAAIRNELNLEPVTE